jgi:hypothetical protein
MAALSTHFERYGMNVGVFISKRYTAVKSKVIMLPFSFVFVKVGVGEYTRAPDYLEEILAVFIGLIRFMVLEELSFSVVSTRYFKDLILDVRAYDSIK